MTHTQSLEKRLEILESRNEIIELSSKYAIACDEHDIPGLLQLFTEDCEFYSPSGLMSAKGKAAIEAMFVALFKIRGPAFHWTHDAVIKINADKLDEASGRVLGHAETSPAGATSLAALTYDDLYRRINGRWFFSRRSVSFLYYVPASEYSSVLTKDHRITVGGKSLPGDYPEKKKTWTEFHRLYS